MSEPAPMPTYWALAEEVTHLHGQLDKLQAENTKLLNARDMWQENDAKLRELVRHMHTCMKHHSCSTCEYDGDACDFEYDMRELGMRVN